MTSGVGPRESVLLRGRPVIRDNEHKGRHQLDHPRFHIAWKLPEIGAVKGSASFMNTHYAVEDRWLAQTANTGPLVNFYALIAPRRYAGRVARHLSNQQAPTLIRFQESQ
jgi:hypothetical protein